MTVIGAGLVMQPDRFQRTPSYHNLMVILIAQTWGLMYLAVALVLVAWLTFAKTQKRPGWVIVAHLPALMLTSGWLAAFVIRWLTDSATTVVNVVSWGVLLALLIRSVMVAYIQASLPQQAPSPPALLSSAPEDLLILSPPPAPLPVTDSPQDEDEPPDTA